MHLLYLQTEPKLDKKFFYLSRVFQQYSITLVPIGVSDLINMKLTGRDYILCIEKNIETRNNFLKVKNRYLDFAMKSGKLAVFDVSSFAPHPIHANIYRQKSYIHIKLPIEMDDLAREIALMIFQEKSKRAENWPGGRRAKLPM
ncbi:hypothetical protein [Bacteriovorax sp. BSW11_IV]|uniref:hypothetical protein n=1 Tax=Bacteriovorax sp. BSW11_IV TaxID=1353529 RepID=UPI000554B2DD|nr:hypothetical protein [Bacteriovorax sp. BSW11_IV]